MSFDKWKARLAGQKVMAFVTPDHEDEGYYRKPITEKVLGADGKTNGQTRTIGWVPVAYFLDQGALICLLGNKEVRIQDEALWSWVVSNPIPYETYKAVAEDGKPWPDLPSTGPRMSENVGAVDHEKPKAPETAEDFKALVATLVGSTSEAKVETDAEANSVNGSINKLAEVRLAADRAGKALYKPLYDKYKALLNIWSPIVAACETEEKRLSRLLLTYRESVRKRIAEEQAVAAKAAAAAEAERIRLAQEEEERNRRATDRAIVNGEAPPEPEVVETEEVALPPPPPPPPALVPTYGKRKVKEEEKIFITITDIDKVFGYFRQSTEIAAVLNTLALAAARAGHDVPGITTRKGLI